MKVNNRETVKKIKGIKFDFSGKIISVWPVSTCLNFTNRIKFRTVL